MINARRLATLSFLFTAALWIGCSADAGNGATTGAITPGTTPDDTGEADDDAGGDVTADAAKPTPKADAGIKKKDAGQVQADDAGDDDAAITPPPDAGKKDAATPACNAVGVASVTPVAISGFGPNMNGGTLVDGDYVLIAYKRYISGTSGTTFPPISMGLSISGSTLNLAAGGRSTYTFTASGSTLAVTRTCPSAASTSWTYDVVGDTVTLYGIPPSNGIWYATFKKVP